MAEFTYLTDRSAKEERTYDILNSEKDRKLWDIELQNLRKQREAVKKNKTSSQAENINQIENIEEEDVKQSLLRELINYILLTYDITKKFPVCFGKDSYYQEKFMDYINDMGKKVEEKAKNKQAKDNLNRLAFNSDGLNKKRADKEKEAENEIDAIVKNGEIAKDRAERSNGDISEQNSKDAIENIIKKEASLNEKAAAKAHKVAKVRLIKTAEANQAVISEKTSSAELLKNDSNTVKRENRSNAKRDNGTQRVI